VVAGGCAYRGYNQVIAMDEQVKNNWAQIENQLQRRYDLIPNLVATVQGLTDQERKIFLGVAEARKAYFTAPQGSPERVRAASGLEGALSRLLVLNETYPQLRSNEAFAKLQDEVAGSENRLAIERRRYNDSVRDLNTYIRGPLGGLFAAWAKVQPAEYFEVSKEAREVPKVNFSATQP
jgi:LemA protein